MKVGFSFSRCLVDIYEQRVPLDDVLVIVARTDFDPNNDQHWQGIWNGYTRPGAEWQGYSEDHCEPFRALAQELYDTGRLHQPRQFGQGVTRTADAWRDLSIDPRELARRPQSVQDAWDHFQTLWKLTQD
jgi:hypothetical protein